MGCIISINKELGVKNLLDHDSYKFIKKGKYKKSYCLTFDHSHNHKTIYDYATKKTHDVILITIDDHHILLHCPKMFYIIIDTLHVTAVILPSNPEIHGVTPLYCCTPVIDYTGEKPLDQLFRETHSDSIYNLIPIVNF